MNDDRGTSTIAPERALRLRSHKIRIDVVAGPDGGVTVKLPGPEARLGSGRDADFVVRDPTVSRLHLILRVEEDAIRVLDPGSRNGTTVDGTRVRDAYARPDSAIRIGQTTLRLRMLRDVVELPLSPNDRFGRLLGRSVAMRLTPLGRRIRAVVQNRDLAEVSGISTSRVDRTAFFIGSGLAGVAGVALTLVGPIGPTMGTNVIIDAFLVIVVGGIGQLKGSVIVAFVLGVLQSVLEYSTTVSVAKVLVLVAIVAFLQWRPQGLYTLRTRSLV